MVLFIPKNAHPILYMENGSGIKKILTGRQEIRRTGFCLPAGEVSIVSKNFGKRPKHLILLDLYTLFTDVYKNSLKE